MVKQYKPFLDEIGLTYTQYIAMMVLWEKQTLNVKALGECLYLDSGTLTPLLKKMEQAGLVLRRRSTADERNVVVTLTEKGNALKEEAKDIPVKIAHCLDLSQDEAETLYRLLYKLLAQV